MTTWLHFIGKSYYPSRGAFRREALRYGVSRRVSLQDLSRMHWGDRVLVAMWEGASSVVFGEFRIERLVGLSREATLAVQQLWSVRPVLGDSVKIERLCGMYTVTCIYLVEGAELPEIAHLLKELKARGIDIGTLMVGGRWEDRHPVRLVDVPHRQGYRAFALEAFEQAVDAARREQNRAIPRVSGQFYAEPSSAGIDTSGTLVEVSEYVRADSGSGPTEEDGYAMVDAVGSDTSGHLH